MDLLWDLLERTWSSNLVFEGPITHPSGIQASIPSSISTTMVPSLAKVKAQIESDIDSMGLEDCEENIYKDVFWISGSDSSIRHALDTVATSSMIPNALHSVWHTVDHRPSGCYPLGRSIPPDGILYYSNCYDQNMFQTRCMILSMYHMRIYPRKYPWDISISGTLETFLFTHCIH